MQVKSALQGPIVAAVGLKRHFPISKGTVFRRQVGTVRAVDGINFEVCPGQSFTIVGESGCGKTTTARLVLRLDTPTDGTLLYNEGNADQKKPTGGARSIQAIFQDPYSSLNPRMRVGPIVGEPLRAIGITTAEIKSRVSKAIVDVGLPAEAISRYPHMFSGGQRQRIAIARAIVSEPRLIVLDEPVSALDVSIRAQILNLLKELQERQGIAYLMISHDLNSVRFISDTVAVMYLGCFVEVGPAETIFTAPRHPYTQSLIAAARPGAVAIAVDPEDSGEVPSASNLPSGCRFHPRCLRATDRCRIESPVLRPIGASHTACHHPIVEL